MAFGKKRGKHAKGAKGAETTESATGSVQPVIEPVEAATESEEEDPLAGFDRDAAGYPLDGEAASPDSYVAANFELPAKKKHRALKIFGITLGVIVGVIGIAYVVGAVAFMGRFMPNTVIGESDVSWKSDEEVVQMFDSMAQNYQLDVVSGGFSYRTTGPAIKLAIDGKAIVEGMHEDLNPWTWPVLLFDQVHDESERLAVTFDKQSYETQINQQVAEYNKQATPPVNATIVYDDNTSSYKIKPEEQGTQLDAQAIVTSMGEAISLLEPKLVLTEEQLIQPTVLSDDKKLNESAQLATGMVSAHLTLVLDGQEVDKIDGLTLAEFVSIDEKLDVKLDTDALDEWVTDLAAGFDTIGTERFYTRVDGKEINVSGGSYGWEIDTEATVEEILDGIKSGSDTEIDIPCISTAAVYNGPGERDWGNRYIDIDLSEQYVRFYGDDNSIIWESACISGSPDGEHNTVPGVWYINNKEAPSKLIGYEHGKKIYETTVSYWMAFEGSGIGLHDATWQPAFGGNMFAEGYGSHGCVNLPYDKAQELYGISEIGDVVIVHF